MIDPQQLEQQRQRRHRRRLPRPRLRHQLPQIRRSLWLSFNCIQPARVLAEIDGYVKAII